jgi:pyridoxamine 5'-phosphate oxidase
MNLNDCLKFANENPVCYLATMDGDQPRIRTLLMDAADETGFYFATCTPKDMSKQLHHNPKVEVCFYNNASDLMEAKQMRLCGEVEFIDDPEAKKRAMEPRKDLSQLIGEPVDPYVEVFRISSGDVHFWAMMNAMKEKEIEHLEF